MVCACWGGVGGVAKEAVIASKDFNRLAQHLLGAAEGGMPVRECDGSLGVAKVKTKAIAAGLRDREQRTENSWYGCEQRAQSRRICRAGVAVSESPRDD